MDDTSITSSHASEVNADLVKSKLQEAGIKSIDLPTCTMNVSYFGHEVDSFKLRDMRKGYRICYASDEKTREFDLLSRSHVDSGEERNTIILPTHDNRANFQKILLGIGAGGVEIWFNEKDKCIMMKRMCQSQVFYVNAQSEEPVVPIKVQRDETVELFSYKKFFYSLYTSQVDGVPCNQTFFVIGTKPSMSNKDGLEGIRITLHPDSLKEFSLRAEDSLKEIFVSDPKPIDLLLCAARMDEMCFDT